jgi:hypothetical protein
MTYHDDLAPRRRSWLIATPLILVLVLAAGWSGFWYYAAGEAEARIGAWQAQEAQSGRTFSCGTRSVGGYPFRIEVRCTDVNVELKDAQPPIALKLKNILVVSQVWDPKLLIAEFTGPLSASDPGQPPYLTAAWTLARASVRGTPQVPDRASITIDGMKLEGTVPGAPPLFEARHAEFHARVQFGSWPHNPAVDLAVKLAAAAAPAVHVMAAQPFDADILAVLHGMKELAPKALPTALREWQAAGGRLELQTVRLAQGEALATATGTLALTPRGRLDGALRLSAAGIERFLPTLGGERKGGPLGLDRAAPALNAIDRAIPGLAARITPQAQQSLQAGLLALLGQPVDIEGKRGVALPLKFTDGAASIGPIPLGQVPPAF